MREPGHPRGSRTDAVSELWGPRTGGRRGGCLTGRVQLLDHAARHVAEGPRRSRSGRWLTTHSLEPIAVPPSPHGATAARLAAWSAATPVDFVHRYINTHDAAVTRLLNAVKWLTAEQATPTPVTRPQEACRISRRTRRPVCPRRRGRPAGTHDDSTAPTAGLPPRRSRSHECGPLAWARWPTPSRCHGARPRGRRCCAPRPAITPATVKMRRRSR